MDTRIAIRFAQAAAVCALLAGAAQAGAQSVYKCVSAGGSLRYADAPCQPAESMRMVQLQPNSLDATTLREAILRQENERLREQVRSAQAGNGPAEAGTGAVPARTEQAQAERIDSLACQRARRDYEVTASSSANTRAIIEAKRSMMYGACGMREPDVTRNVVHQTVVVRRAPVQLAPGTALAVLP